MGHDRSEVVELAGAALILLAYWANAGGRWSRNAPAYLWVNLAGALLLGMIAYKLRRWGFVLLEVAWAGISIVSLWHRSRIAPITPPLPQQTAAEEHARLLELLKTQALTPGHFILSSGKESSYYLDGRLVTLSPEGGYLTGKLMLEQLGGLEIQAVGGLTLGADPVATAISVLSFREGRPIPAFLVRKDTKAHGKQQLIEGPLPEGARVAIVEDTVTTGESILTAVTAVEALGCTVAIVLCLVDRLEGARERIEGMGYRFDALFTIRDLGIEA